MSGEDNSIQLGRNKFTYNGHAKKLEKDNLTPNLKKIFDFFDKDNSGTIEDSELKNIWNTINTAAAKNNNSIFEEVEAQELLENSKVETEKSLAQQGVKVNDMFKFIRCFLYPATPEQNEAVRFLFQISSDANSTMLDREKDAGGISNVANFWRECINSEYSKSSVNQEIKDTELDASYLMMAANGTFGAPSIKFNEYFKLRRGVDFKEKNITDCSEKAQTYSVVKNAVEMTRQIKQVLSSTTTGTLHNRMNPQEASGAILKAFNMAGINDINEINKVLNKIADKYKNYEAFKKCGKDLKFCKNKNGEYVIYRGNKGEATQEQLNIIAKELMLKLDISLAKSLDINTKGKTQKQLLQEIDEVYNERKQEYEESFKKAYGGKDVAVLAEQYVLKQQQDVANIEMALDVVSMGLMLVPGAGGAAGWLLKTASGATKVKKVVSFSKQIIKFSNKAQQATKGVMPVAMGVTTLRPVELLEQLTSENGMSKEEWEQWGSTVLQNVTYMAGGIGASKLAESSAALFKTRYLVQNLKASGKNIKEVVSTLKNTKNIPNDVLKILDKVDNLSKTFQISTEVALDLGLTYVINKTLGNGDLLPQDVVMSMAFALSGGVFQKEFMPLSSEAKVKNIQKAFKDFDISEEDAEIIAKAMDDISAGNISSDDVKSIEEQARIAADLVGNNTLKPVEVNGQRFSTNDVAEVKGEVKVSSDAEIKEVGKSDFEVEYNDYKGLAGSITIKDSQGTQLGNVNYSILEQNGRKVLKFEGLESNKLGMNIGTKLIEELVMKSIELGAEGRLIAEASPATGSGANGRPISNLGFYYKLGFKADDPVIDVKIREFIESGKEIPLSLNIFTKISLTEEGINYIVKNNKSNLANSIDAETAKPINAPTKISTITTCNKNSNCK